MMIIIALSRHLNFLIKITRALYWWKKNERNNDNTQLVTIRFVKGAFLDIFFSFFMAVKVVFVRILMLI